VGDVCLDRYLEIDPGKQERSIETGLAVHNVVNVRSSPGAAGTVINNLCALGIKRIYPVSFCGDDGEGFELRRDLESKPGVSLHYFHVSPDRRTFTYTKPLLVTPGKSPRELNRFDLKNWIRTPTELENKIVDAIAQISDEIDAMIVLDQVDRPGTGVVTARVLNALAKQLAKVPKKIVLADSRRGLRDFPPLIYKMNRAELAKHTKARRQLRAGQVRAAASALAQKNKRDVFVTLAAGGIIGVSAQGDVEHVRALPVRGEIDIVGAGDAVTANLVTALAAGAQMREAMELAMAAASIVIHKLGTTGTASVAELRKMLLLLERAV